MNAPDRSSMSATLFMIERISAEGVIISDKASRAPLFYSRFLGGN
jgi:hypothetical protein